MRFGVAVATTGRAPVLNATLPFIRAALRPGDRLVVVGASLEDWPTPEACEGAELLLGPKGSTLQRNVAIDRLIHEVDAIVFFDDDFLPRADWLAKAERLLQSQPDVAAFTGRVIADGICGPGLSLREGTRALGNGQVDAKADPPLEEDVPSYGCNMGFRAAAIGEARFDPRLRLYAWQEDSDFSWHVARKGRRVRDRSLAGVHLGVKLGRVPGRKLGYAQIVNPLYLLRKGSMSLGHALPLMARNLAANLAKAFRPEPWVDRRGRLGGNLAALADLCAGRIEPERVEQL